MCLMDMHYKSDHFALLYCLKITGWKLETHLSGLAMENFIALKYKVQSRQI